MVALGRGTGRVVGACGQEGDLVSVTTCKYYLFKAVNKEKKVESECVSCKVK